MLVITRKPGEGLVIAGEIEVTVLGVERDQVKIGINAPRHIPVHRREIHQLIQSENLAAAARPAPDLVSMRKLIAPRKPQSD